LLKKEKQQVVMFSTYCHLKKKVLCTIRTSFFFLHRKCPRTNRINRQKQNTMHYNSENTLRASTRLIWAPWPLANRESWETEFEQKIKKLNLRPRTETLHPAGWWDGGTEDDGFYTRCLAPVAQETNREF